MGKRIYGIRSFAYRIPHPHAAAASRLRLPRIWNPSLNVRIIISAILLLLLLLLFLSLLLLLLFIMIMIFFIINIVVVALVVVVAATAAVVVIVTVIIIMIMVTRMPLSLPQLLSFSLLLLSPVGHFPFNCACHLSINFIDIFRANLR